jgi:iron complex transport system substrate-binding protein
MRRFPPFRIICLTEETVETLYLLGEQDRIVGVSGYAARPAEVRREKARVSAFTSADIPKILALEPDLVLSGDRSRTDPRGGRRAGLQSARQRRHARDDSDPRRAVRSPPTNQIAVDPATQASCVDRGGGRYKSRRGNVIRKACASRFVPAERPNFAEAEITISR